MKRRFLIAVEGLTTEQDREFRKYFEENGNWWHWISNFYLFVTTDESISTDDICAAAKEAGTSIRILAMEMLEDITWTTIGKSNSKGKSMSDWLKNTWGGE